MRLARVIGSVVLSSGLTAACVTIGEATYVVQRAPGTSCESACSRAGQFPDGGDSWRVGEMLECVDGQYVDPTLAPTSPRQPVSMPQVPQGPQPSTRDVAVCRMRTHYTGGVGRRPVGLVEHAESLGRTWAGAFFARVAHLEAASVAAFERLAEELDAHGAPASLVARARRAAREETRHAHVTARWREHFGGTALPLLVESPGLLVGESRRTAARTLAEIARENAAEGCVHETWGAVLATVQAARAVDPALRRDLAGIARDEVGHAELACSVRTWAMTRIGRDERIAMHAAELAAIDSIERDVTSRDATDACRDGARTVGLPIGDDARLLFARTRSAIWDRLAA